MKKVKCKKEYGIYFYKRIGADELNGLDAAIYELYDAEQNYIEDFGSYGDMKYYIETGCYL